jgi:hypothetical protein
MRAIDVGFAQIKLAAIAQVFGERTQDRFHHARLRPLLKSAVAGLIGRISGRQVGPRRPRAQDPQHAVEHGARINPRAPALRSRRTKLRLRDVRSHRRPLIVGDVHL